MAKTNRTLRPVFKKFLQLEATPDSDTQNPRLQRRYMKAGQQMDKLFDRLTEDEQLFYESGHREPHWPEARKFCNKLGTN